MKVLITGANRGIGASLAAKLAGKTEKIFLLGRNGSALKEIAEKCNIEAGYNQAIPVVFDLHRLFSEGNKFTYILAEYTDSLDCLVNNAGSLIRKSFEDISYTESLELFRTNYFAPVELIKLCLPFFKGSEQASIVNVASMAAVQGSSKFKGLTAYSASKGALATLTECLAEEFKELNIHVNALAFGAVQTEMLEEAFPGYRANTSSDEMGSFFSWFVLEGWKRFNGKILPVTESTP